MSEVNHDVDGYAPAPGKGTKVNVECRAGRHPLTYICSSIGSPRHSSSPVASPRFTMIANFAQLSLYATNMMSVMDCVSKDLNSHLVLATSSINVRWKN